MLNMHSNEHAAEQALLNYYLWKKVNMFTMLIILIYVPFQNNPLSGGHKKIWFWWLDKTSNLKISPLALTCF